MILAILSFFPIETDKFNFIKISDSYVFILLTAEARSVNTD